MERLTKQLGDKYFYKSMPYQDNFYIAKVTTKLGHLEDIEEELGIPLEVLFKAFDEGIYFKSKNGKSYPVDDIHLNSILFWLRKFAVDCKPEYELEEGCDYIQLLFKDYGKTWALTKEELE